MDFENRGIVFGKTVFSLSGIFHEQRSLKWCAVFDLTRDGIVALIKFTGFINDLI